LLNAAMAAAIRLRAALVLANPNVIIVGPLKSSERPGGRLALQPCNHPSGLAQLPNRWRQKIRLVRH
jgi:hypothetical protein